MDISRKSIETLSDDQTVLLNRFRKDRNFNPTQYIKLKAELISRYLKSNNLNTIVVGISGGIDSAVVLGILAETKKLGQLKEIIPVCLPALESNGVSNQRDVLTKAQKLCENFEIKCVIHDISNSLKLIEKEVGKVGPWSSGQLVSVMRVPYFNYISTLSTAIICGTANRSEIFLGYTGKYSDLMVDIQIITDLYKSEVYAVANELNIPQEILNAIPRGDVFDNSSDEDIFGASYDAVELYSYQKFDGQAAKNIEELRKYNRHKFKVGSPAIHLDLYESGFGDVWNTQFETRYWQNLKNQGDIIKPQFVAPMNFADITFESTEVKVSKDDDILLFENVLTPNEIKQLKDLYYSSNKKDANVFGYTNSKTKEVGSNRATLYNIKLAEMIWTRIKPFLDKLIVAEKPTTDWNIGEIYRLVGVSPLHRFIGYNTGGSLVSHYDYSYIDGKYKTLFSLVIGLTDNTTGPTNFLFDDQDENWNKDLSDKKPDYIQNIKKSYLTKAGNVMMFPHHLLHSGGEVNNEEKLIIRTDVVCEKIDYA